MKNMMKFFYVFSALFLSHTACLIGSDSPEKLQRPRGPSAAAVAQAPAQTANPIAGPLQAYKMLPLKLPVHPFNPDELQSLRGEKIYEKQILAILPKLKEVCVALASHSQHSFEYIRKDEKYLKIMAQIVNSFLSLFHYACYLPDSNRWSPLRSYHVNTVEEVFEDEKFTNTILAIHDQLPLLSLGTETVFNQELTRWDYHPAIRIGASPFFQPVSDLLYSLYVGNDTTDINDVLDRADSKLQKRYFYFNHIKPLGQIYEQLNKIVHALHTFSLGSDLQLLESLSTLKDMITQDIDYKYDCSQKKVPPSPLQSIKDLREQIPWSDLLAVGSAAEYAPRNIQGKILEVFHAANPELLLDFKKLQSLLHQLQWCEHAYFLNQTLPGQRGGGLYPAIKRVAEWYRCYIGLGMMEDHMKEIKELTHLFCNSALRFEDVYPQSSHPIQKCSHLRLDLAQCDCAELAQSHAPRVANIARERLKFVQNSRVLFLFYIFADGELSKLFIKALEENTDKDFVKLFKSFRGLRDGLAHSTQARGQNAIEDSLNSLDDQIWNQFLRHYHEVVQDIHILNKRTNTFKWSDPPEGDWAHFLSKLYPRQRDRITALTYDLESLLDLLMTSSWDNPLRKLERGHHHSMKKFEKMFPAGSHQTFFPLKASKLLKEPGKKWDAAVKGLGTLNPAMLEHWADMKAAARRFQTEEASSKARKAPEPPPQERPTDLQNLSCIASKLLKTYEMQLIMKDELKQFREIYDHRLVSLAHARMAEVYLILLRKSAKRVIEKIFEPFDFRSHDPQGIKLFQACLALQSRLSCLVSSICNQKAHIHVLTEASLFELSSQDLGPILMPHLKGICVEIQDILQGPEHM